MGNGEMNTQEEKKKGENLWEFQLKISIDIL